MCLRVDPMNRPSATDLLKNSEFNKSIENSMALD